MKKLVNLLLVTVLGIVLFSCATVDSGHKGVAVGLDGTEDKVYDEGTHISLKWLYTEMIPYNIKEKTITYKFVFNDKDNMKVPVEISVDYYLNPKMVNKFHVNIDDLEAKVEKTIKSASKEVVPSYAAVELNLDKRKEGEDRLTEILKEEFPKFYTVLARVQMSDVDIPEKISSVAEQIAVQESNNILASKKEQEQKYIADAAKAKAKGIADAAIEKSKGLATSKINAAKADSADAAIRNSIFRDPNYRTFFKLETERIRAEGFKTHGYGTGNMYGVNTSVVKGLK